MDRKLQGWGMIGLAAAIAVSWFPPMTLAQTPCAKDVATLQGMMDKALADRNIERGAYDAGLQRLSRIRAVCASGDEKLARALAIEGVIALELATDDAYAQSLNAARPPQ